MNTELKEVKWFRCLRCRYITGWDGAKGWVTEADSKPCPQCGGLMIHVSKEDPEVQAFLSA